MQRGLSLGYVNDDVKTRAEADALTSELCSLVKRDGIKIIAITFEIAETSTKTLLSSCASSPSDYHDAQSPDALKKAFAEIGTSLHELRLMR